MESNCVIIRLWYFKADDKDVGHATLQTPNEYLSLWPCSHSKAKTEGGQLFEHHSGVYFASCYQEDLEAKERPPEYICTLYSLSVSQIDSKIREIKLETNQYSTSGNTKFVNWSRRVSRSCYGAVHEALIAGKISTLALPGLNTHLEPSHDNIYIWARRSKRVELRMYPNTKEYDNRSGLEYNSHEEVSTMGTFRVLGKRWPLL